MAWWNKPKRNTEVTNMKELRRSLQETLDALYDKDEEFASQISEKDAVIEDTKAERDDLARERAHNASDITKAEKALSLVSGKRTRT